MERIPKEFERGQRQSADDIAAGRPRLFWQTRGSWGELLSRLMADHFEVVVEHTSDITTQAEVSFRMGYNAVTEAHVDKVFGRGSFQMVLDEVERFRFEEYQKFLRSRERGNS